MRHALLALLLVPAFAFAADAAAPAADGKLGCAKGLGAEKDCPDCKKAAAKAAEKPAAK